MDPQEGLGRARGRSRGVARGLDNTDNSTDNNSTLGRGRGPPMMTSLSSQVSPSDDTSETQGRGLRRGMERGRASLMVQEDTDGLEGRVKQMSFKDNIPETLAPARMFNPEVLYDQIQTKDTNVIVENTHATGPKVRKIRLQTNVLFLQNKPGWTIYSYSVEFRPALDSKVMKKVVLKQHNDDLFDGAGKFIFDGTKLWTRTQLEDGATVIKRASQLKNGDTVKFRLKFIAEHDITDPISLQVYNLHFHRYQEMLEMKEIAKCYYFDKLAKSATSKGHKFQIWPGVIARINRFEKVLKTDDGDKYEDRPALLLDTKSKVVRQESCYDAIKVIKKSAGTDFKNKCKKELVGSTVIVSYGNNDYYRIQDVIFDQNPASTFDSRGKEISYMEYYQERYNLKIKDPKQPLFSCKPKKKMPGKNNNIMIIPELCSPTGLTDAMRMDFNIMKDLAAYTRKSPTERFAIYKDIYDKFQSNNDVKNMMKNWGIKFEKTGFEQADGIHLSPVDINMTQKGAKKTVKGTDKADWDRDLKSCNLLMPPEPCKKWVFIGNKKSEKDCDKFSKALTSKCKQLGWKFSDPKEIKLVSSDKDQINTAKDFIAKQVDFIVCFVQRENKSVYDAVKKACLSSGTASQFVKERTAGKNTDSVALKVALQMACKFGGEPWSVKMPPTIKKATVMYIGIDVYHDTIKKSDSVYALVASLNPEVTRWFSTHQVLGQTEEVGNAIRTMIIEAAEAWKGRNGDYPGQIYVYRDGVGDTDLSRVKMVEVNMVVKALKDLKEKAGMENNIGLTFSVVKKRIDHKFLKISKSGYENPPAGTVCDTVLTKKIWYDFFLVSQLTRQGTVTPIHVNIIHDTVGLEPSKVQMITFNLCHLYYNWPGTVRVPAPVQYAHKLAQLIGDNVHQGTEVAIGMKDKLFFL